MTLFGKDLKVVTAMCGSKASGCKICQHLEASVPGMKKLSGNSSSSVQLTLILCMDNIT